MHRAWLMAITTFACAPSAATQAPPTASAAHALPTNFAPRPFTAEQIRNAWPQGSVSRYRTEEKGKPTVIAETRVAEATSEHAVFETTTLSLEGEPLGTPQRSTSTWSELMAHATFPAARTTIEDVIVDTPAGSFDAWRYTVLPKDGGGDMSRYYFAKQRPGAPVRYEQTKAGETVFKVELLSTKAP